MPGRRGILGVRKDPKNQVLFMTNGEEWPSSDSDDTDYEPGKTCGCLDLDWVETDSGDDSSGPGSKSGSRGKAIKRRKGHEKLPPSKRRKTTGTPQPKQGQRATTGSAKKGNGAGPSAMIRSSSRFPGLVPSCTPVPRLPVEVWLKIFQCVVDAHGAIPFLGRAAKVCQEWSRLARVPHMWRRVDLSYGWIKSSDRTLKWLACHRLLECREINLSGWKNLTSNTVKALVENCPDLEVINLSHCKKLSSDTVRVFADGCEKIRSMDMSHTTSVATSVGSLRYFVTKVGPTLKELYLAGNTQTSFGPALRAIMSNCPHLETLDLNGIGVNMVVNVEKLQENLKCLRVLALGNCHFRSAVDDYACQGAGFQNLEELSCAMTHQHHQLHQRGVPDSMLIRLLHNARGLRLLDLRGCMEMNPWHSILTNHKQASNIVALEKLYLGHSSITTHCVALARMLQQWAHSLRVLDLSWITPMEEFLEETFGMMLPAPFTYPLTDMNLTGSTVNTACVLIILKAYSNLQTLDLTSCRALPRGFKGLHTGPMALRELQVGLEALSDTDTSD